jgi:glycosyltransferase involved in cell wall biosynthesis
MLKKTVDIILPVYNSKKYILATINSIIKQTYKSWNLIIIDDCSNDGTYEILNNIKRKYNNQNKIFLYRQNVNQGQAEARNFGLNKSKSTFAAFIDSDDLWEKNKLKKQIEFMKNNNYNFTYSDYISVKNNNKKKLIIVPDTYDYNTFIRNTSIATSTMIIKKKFINNIFFPHQRLCEDFYFKCLILKKTKAYKCPSVYSYYKIRNNSLQNDRIKVLLTVWDINKNLNKMNFFNNLASVFFIIYNSLKKYGFR